MVNIHWPRPASVIVTVMVVPPTVSVAGGVADGEVAGAEGEFADP